MWAGRAKCPVAVVWMACTRGRNGLVIEWPLHNGSGLSLLASLAFAHSHRPLIEWFNRMIFRCLIRNSGGLGQGTVCCWSEHQSPGCHCILCLYTAHVPSHTCFYTATDLGLTLTSMCFTVQHLVQPLHPFTIYGICYEYFASKEYAKGRC